MTPMEQALQKATGTKPKAKEERQDYLKRLHGAATDLSDKEWDELDNDTQGWVNDATRADDAGKPIPDFDGAEPETEEPEAEGEEPDAEEPKKEAKVANSKRNGGSAKKAAKEEPKKAPARKASGGRGVKGDGYKGHRAGSRKEAVHKVFDEKGAEAAIKKAVALDIQENTARSWISSWGGNPGKKASKAKK